MSINRRQFILSSAAIAGTPALSSCSSDKPTPSIDSNYPVGPFGADSTAEEVSEGMDLSGQHPMFNEAMAQKLWATAESMTADYLI